MHFGGVTNNVVRNIHKASLQVTKITNSKASSARYKRHSEMQAKMQGETYGDSIQPNFGSHESFINKMVQYNQNR